jgi:hypothetical protein
VDALLQQQAGAGDAGLTRGGEDAGNSAVDGLIDDAVVEHDVRRFAAEFQRHLLERACGQLIDARAGRRAAGKGNLCDLGVRYQRLTDDGPVAGHDVDDPRRDSCRLEHEADELQDRG